MILKPESLRTAFEYDFECRPEIVRQCADGETLWYKVRRPHEKSRCSKSHRLHELGIALQKFHSKVQPMYYEVKKISMEKNTPKIGRQYRVQYTNPVYEPQWLKTSDLHKAKHTIRDWNAVKTKIGSKRYILKN